MQLSHYKNHLLYFISTLVLAGSASAATTPILHQLDGCRYILSGVLTPIGMPTVSMSFERNSIASIHPHLITELEIIRHMHNLKTPKSPKVRDFTSFAEVFADTLTELQELMLKQQPGSLEQYVLAQGLLQLRELYKGNFDGRPVPVGPQERRGVMKDVAQRQRAIFTEILVACLYRGKDILLRQNVARAFSDQLKDMPPRFYRPFQLTEVDIIVKRQDSDAQIWIEVKNNVSAHSLPEEDTPQEVLDLQIKTDNKAVEQIQSLILIRQMLKLDSSVRIGIIFRNPISPELRQRLRDAGADFIGVLFPS